ncbi:ornithine decarboxylase antizyme [Rhexocercosporidium sp. MPI-PUGE-AT-0058]|nr:ornithine decarboxylase antizyme [Rhexocercosporidium sp. MPI-PUGE-AT-0058]
MAPSKQSNSSSNWNGETVVNSVLASAYAVDSSARLAGFHYSTTGAGGTGIPEVGSSGIPSPPSSPPLAALTSANELALISKNNRKRDTDGKRKSRKEGAAYLIREECERLFCETMKVVFLGDAGKAANNGSIGMGANAHSPPDDSVNVYNDYFVKHPNQAPDAWVEIWDYSGGCSFRGFVGGDGDKKSLFAFFDSAVVGRDLKQGLMALIELAETVFAVNQVVICLDRNVPEVDRKAFLKSLRWVGFDLISLDMWANDFDVTSDRWLYLGMEV